jgi:hypothetical protein
MALRFLADHCVSNSTVQTLREANHEVLRLKDVLPVESKDSIVITKALPRDSNSQMKHFSSAICGRITGNREIML